MAIKLSLGIPITLVANQVYALPSSAVQVAWQNPAGADLLASLDGTNFSSIGVSTANEVKTVPCAAISIKCATANTIAIAKNVPMSSTINASSVAVSGSVTTPLLNSTGILTIKAASASVVQLGNADALCLSIGSGGVNPVDDNAKDLAYNAARFRNGYFGTSVIIGTNPASTGAIRLPNNQAVVARDAAGTNNREILKYDASNSVVIGPQFGYVKMDGSIVTALNYTIAGAGVVVNRTKAGTPTDADVTNPTDGMLIIDTTANKIWARIGGVWKQTVALT